MGLHIREDYSRITGCDYEYQLESCIIIFLALNTCSVTSNIMLPYYTVDIISYWIWYVLQIICKIITSCLLVLLALNTRDVMSSIMLPYSTVDITIYWTWYLLPIFYVIIVSTELNNVHTNVHVRSRGCHISTIISTSAAIWHHRKIDTYALLLNVIAIIDYIECGRQHLPESSRLELRISNPGCISTNLVLWWRF